MSFQKGLVPKEGFTLPDQCPKRIRFTVHAIRNRFNGAQSGEKLGIFPILGICEVLLGNFFYGEFPILIMGNVNPEQIL